MKSLLTILFMLTALLTHAQVTFQRVYGKQGGVVQFSYGMQQTSNGGFIIVGGWYDSTTKDGYVLRTNSDGNTLWAKSYKTTLSGYFKSVQQTADDGFIMTGYFYDSTNIDNCYLLKIDSNGNVQWDKSFAEIDNLGASVMLTSDGGYMVSRQISNEISLIKMDGNGNVQWNKSFGNSSLFFLSLGWPNDIAKTKDGGFIITGTIRSLTSWNRDVYLLKTDSSGNVLWNKSYSAQKREVGASVIETQDGGFFIVGTVDTPFVNDERALLIKTDSDGNLQWSKTSVGIMSYGFGAAPTSDSGIVFTGLLIDSFMNQTAIYKVDYNGNLLWAKNNLDSSSLLTKILETQDGGLAMVGYKFLSSTKTAKTLFIKTDKDGNSGCMEKNLPVQLINYPMSVDTLIIFVNPISDSVSSGFTIAINLPKEDSILCTTAGMQNHPDIIQQVSVYPNPFTTATTIEIKNLGFTIKDLKILMYNVFGQEVHPFVIRNSDSFVIRRNNLPAGIYFYRITSNASYQPSNKIISTGKLIIQ